MKHFFTCFAPFALLALGAVASLSDVDLERQFDDSADDLDEWLAAAKKASPAALRSCPVSCRSTRNSTSSAEWFLFPDSTKLASCNDIMLLDMVVQSTVEDNIDSDTIVRACTADYDEGMEQAFVPDANKASLCTTANRVLEEASLHMHHPATGNDGFSVNHFLSAASQITNHLAVQKPSCTNNAIEFAYSQSAIVGLFAGAEVHQHGVTGDVLEKLLEYAQSTALSKSTVVQLCGADDRGADYSIGIVATSTKNLAFVKESVKNWASGKCVSQADTGNDWMKVTLRIPVPVETTSNNGTNSTAASNGTTTTHLEARSRLVVRADCRTASVESGDGCWAVANRCGIGQADLERYNRANLCTTLVRDEKVCCSSGTLPSTLPGGNSDGTCKTRAVVSKDDCGSLASKCGISAADFMKVNTKADLCSTLAPGQQVCCSDGIRPDFRPEPESNGNCAVYTTTKGDSCSEIAASRDLSVSDLESFNRKTWGWNGCEKLFPDYKLCVSTGSPPMPANVPVRRLS